MLSIISTAEREKWNSTVKSYRKWDVYYLCEYAETFQVYGDGVPLLIAFENGDDRFCCAVMRRDISEDVKFAGCLDSGRYFDLETPYGYGGPLCDHALSVRSQELFWREMREYALDRGIVSLFIRFHPLLRNQEALPAVFETRYLHQTVYIDTSSPETIEKNMDSKGRNMVRKALKNGISIAVKQVEEYRPFLFAYEETMVRNHADQYYFFTEDYFRAQAKLSNYTRIFYAMKENRPVAAAMVYFNDQFMHYHLAGTHWAYRMYAPGNLLLREAACWASERGIRQFHLGGGMEENDALFGFKKQFNRNGRLPFFIGRAVFDRTRYQMLMDLRARTDPGFDRENSRMIQYRF